jgi:hypothetical protein
VKRVLVVTFLVSLTAAAQEVSSSVTLVAIQNTPHESPYNSRTTQDGYLYSRNEEPLYSAELVGQSNITFQISKRLTFAATLAPAVFLNRTYDSRGASFVFNDNGSSISLAISPTNTSELVFSIAPLQASRMYPSFDFANAWGNTSIPPQQAFFVTPAALISFRNQMLEAELVYVRSLLVAPTFVTNKPRLPTEGVFGGIRALFNHASIAVRGGVFDRGSFAQSSPSRKIASGVSAQFRYATEEISAFPDLITYENDPTRFQRFLEHKETVSPWAASVSLEGGLLGQQTDSAGESNAQVEPASYGETQVRVRWNRTTASFTARLQSASHIQFDSPQRIEPWMSPSALSSAQTDLFFGLRKSFANRFHFGTQLQLRHVATFGRIFFGPGRYADGHEISFDSILRARDFGGTIPHDAAPGWVATLKMSALVDFNSHFSLLAEANFVNDPTRVLFSDSGLSRNQFANLSMWSVSSRLAIQARF